MAIPSLQYLSQQAIISFRRFPSVLLAAIIAAITAVMVISLKPSQNHYPLLNITLCAALGIPLFFSLMVFAHKRRLARKKIIIAHVVATVLLCLLFFTFPSAENTDHTFQPYLRYVMYAVTAHLTVSFIPFIGERQVNGFWQYNRLLFLRLFLSILYSAVVFAGISIAIVAVDQLFGVKVHYTIYGKCFAIIAFIFHTWLFISGMPMDISNLDNERSYPKGLRIFAQYVLLSLLVLYIFILYAYGTKIIATWNWPKGIVSYLIVYVSVLGTLTFLLLYPYGKLEEYTWLQKINKWFYILMIPLLSLLFIALFMRIDDYGITENRYILLALGIWLSIVCICQIFGLSNIKFIPSSLAVVPLLISLGPWSMFSVSEHYQVKRLQKILEKEGLLVNGKIVHEVTVNMQGQDIVYKDLVQAPKLTDSLRNEVRSILQYLDEYHGFASIQPWFKQPLKAMLAEREKRRLANPELGKPHKAELYLQVLGLGGMHAASTTEERSIIAMRQPEILDIKDYDALCHLTMSNQDSTIASFEWNGNRVQVFFENKQRRSITINIPKYQTHLSLEKWIDEIIKQHPEVTVSLPPANMIVQSGEDKLQLVIQHVTLTFRDGKWQVKDGEASLLFKTRR